MRHLNRATAAIGLASLAGLAFGQPVVQPSRVYIANDDHTDYWWTASESAYRSAFVNSLDYYLDLASATDANPPDQQSRWNCDGSLWMWTYERDNPARFPELISRIRSGHVSVPLNALCVMLGGTPAEMVLRGMYYPGRIERRHDLRFSLAYLIENQTQPMGVHSLWAGSGASYSWKGVCACATRTPELTDRDREIYRAVGPDRRGVVLKWNSIRGGNNQAVGGYAEARFFPGNIDEVTTNAPFNGFAQRWPYPVIGLFGRGWDDFQTNTTAFVDAARDLSTPARRVIVSNEVDFFEDFLAVTPADHLEEVALSFGNEWELHAATLVEQNARTRRAVEKLRAAEALALVAARIDPAAVDPRTESRDLTFMNMGLFHEHDFGMDYRPLADRLNRIAWQRRLADEIDAYVDGLHADALAALAAALPAAPLAAAARAVVFNPLSWTRTDAADLPWPPGSPEPVRVVDTTTSVELPSQIVTTADGRFLRILASEVPSVGYRVYDILPGPPQPVAPAVTITQAAGNSTIDNGRLAVTLDTRGRITSLVDHNQVDREFIRAASGRFANDFGSDTAGSITVESAGPVSVTLRANISGTPDRTTRVTLHHGSDRVDIHNTLDGPLDGINTWTFSYNVDQPIVRHEEVGAILTARRAAQGGDYADRSARIDWLTLGHFADTSGSADPAGITLINHDLAFFSLGNSSPTFLDTQTPVIAALAGGPVVSTVSEEQGLPDQGGDRRFSQRFALRPHTGYDQPAAMRAALEATNPLVAAAVTAATPSLPEAPTSFLTITNPAVLAWAVKTTDDAPTDPAAGIVVRVWNLTNTTAQAGVGIPGARLAMARPLSHIETDLGGPDFPLSTDRSLALLTLDRQQIQTLVLTEATCPADLSPALGTLDINDVLAFATAFNTADASADFAEAFGVLDINDVLIFAASFNAGCP